MTHDNKAVSTPQTSGIHHLGLTVSNVEESAEFFASYLGFNIVARKPDYPAIFVSDGRNTLTLWQVQSDSPLPFDRKSQLGLHHFALLLAEGLSLDEVYKSLQSADNVQIEFPPQLVGPGPARHFMMTIPGGPRMEIVSPQG